MLNGMNIVGEAGAEGILPLQGPNGDYWMNKVADNIANRLLSNNNSNNSTNSQPINVVLKVDGREFGKCAIDNINAVQREANEVLLEI